MMTAKEEAEGLIQLFYNNQCSHSVTELAYRSAKQCALICVEEILKSHYKVLIGVMPKTDNYWQEVKQEILKL